MTRLKNNCSLLSTINIILASKLSVEVLVTSEKSTIQKYWQTVLYRLTLHLSVANMFSLTFAI